MRRAKRREADRRAYHRDKERAKRAALEAAIAKQSEHNPGFMPTLRELEKAAARAGRIPTAKEIIEEARQAEAILAARRAK